MLRRRSRADDHRRAAVAVGARRRRPHHLNGSGKPDPPRPPQGIIGFSRRPTRREWRRAGITFVIGIVALFLVVFLVHPQPPLLAAGSTAPRVHLRSVDGSVVTAAGGKTGRPVLLMFFQATCASCGSAMPALCHLAASETDVSVVAVDAGNDDIGAVRMFRGRFMPPGCPIQVLLDPGLAVSRAYAVAVVPTAYVVDAHGVVQFGGYGADGLRGAEDALQRVSHGL